MTEINKINGEEWGYVDEEGNIHLRDGELTQGRIIGKMRGDDKEAALAFYVNRFVQMERRFEELEKRIQSDGNKVRYIDLVDRMVERLKDYDALGDFDGLLKKLNRLQGEMDEFREERKAKKEELCRKAEELSTSDDWKPTIDALTELQEEWKKTGTAGKEYDDALWERFKSAQDKFYERRRAYLSNLELEYGENRKKKEELCQKAQELCDSNDWKGTHEALLKLQDQWKEAGYAGREYDEDLWQIFRAIQDRFYSRREEHFRELDQEREQNRLLKLELCSRAETLSESTDWQETHEKLRELMDEWKKIGSAGQDHEDELWERFKGAQDKFYKNRGQHLDGNVYLKEDLINVAESLIYMDNLNEAKEKVKELQRTWKTIGPVPRDVSDELWNRFRKACDEVFETAREEYKRKQKEWKNGMREAIERKQGQIKGLRGSIAHDKDLIERWRRNISNLYFSDKAEEILNSMEEKIVSVEEKIQSKEDRISELQKSIHDMETKLRN